ncbi:diguanylate cyclase domain-containing protein [Aquabacterium sp.]|uniref:diguanylate cyclase domain-containing protein n=1 Tax=Aquabacterium sp. TaxID=1872578 RepID=UPI002BCCBC7F|nr:diguanylate cyclase [Aquabacterium sp.]HSW07005.1 diguanylate cyclase [Aquabacterium sp.]
MLRRCLRFALLLLLAGVWAAAGAALGETPVRWQLPGDRAFQHLSESAAAGASALVQDAEGFFWVGGQTGLARWDGLRWRAHVPDLGTPGALPDNFVQALHVDARGRLWVGTSAGGLARYEPRDDNFAAVAVGPGGLGDANVTALAADGSHGLWVGTGAGLNHLDFDSGRVSQATGPLPNRPVHALLTDRQGALWVGTRSGLLRRAPGATGFEPVPLQTREGPTPVVIALHQDGAGRLWIGTRRHGAFMVEAGQARAQAHAVREAGRVDGLRSDTVLSISEATAGEIWFGTDGGGIVRFDVASGQTRRERHDSTQPASLADDDIAVLYRDRSGVMWVSSNRALSRHDPRQRSIDTLFAGPERMIGHANLPSLLALSDGRVWVGIGDGGVEILDPVAGRVGRLRPDPERPQTSLPKGRVIGMAQAPDATVYLGTQGGLYRASADGRRVQRLTVAGRRDTDAVWALYFDQGRLWLGGTDGLWLLELDPQGLPQARRHLGAGELGDARVTVLHAGAGSALWVGTRTGLVRVDRSSGEVERLPADPADKTRLPGGHISALLTDRQERLWVATFGRGIQIEQGRDAAGQRLFRRLGTRDGLPHNGVDALLADAGGHVWASTDGGLARIDAQQLTVRVLGRAQGLGVMTFWTNAGAALPSGELLFGGQGGLVVVHPERLLPPGGQPPVVVTEITVGGRSMPPGRLNAAPVAGAVADRPLEPLRVSARDPSLMVEFAVLDYSAPADNRYAYRLRGFDDEWIATPATRRLASYTNLPPGDYTLELRGAGPEGHWSARTVALPLRVEPAWHQHLLVRLVAGLLLLGLLGALMQGRVMYLRRRERQLQRLVAERTAELEQRGEQLRGSQRQLEHMAYFDALTGLPNRRMFNDDLRRRNAQVQRGHGVFALALVDLDHFKQINDTLGHDAGDALLVAAAQRLQAVVREGDLVARLGGDEFAVLLAEAHSAEAIGPVCQRMLERLAEPLLWTGPPLQTSASIGVALCPHDGNTPDSLYKAADVALYDAKRAGRNTWRRWRHDRAAPNAPADAALSND